MTVLFVSMLGIHLKEHGIYSDLIHALLNSGHKVILVDDQNIRNTEKQHKNLRIVPIGISINKFKNRYIKGFLSLILEFIIILVMKFTVRQESIDVMLYATPPIMYTHLLKRCKRRYRCKTFLMLKDIFPQNAVDERILTRKSILFHYLRRKEKGLYHLSDYIGCMSPENIRYLLENNSEIKKDKVILFPNSIQLQSYRLRKEFINRLRERLCIDKNKVVFVFGGNLGIAQGISFLIKVMKAFENHPSAFFLIVGKGTHAESLKKLSKEQKNVLYLERLSTKRYARLLTICDVGIVSLGQMYTIPNYPSRMLSYMEAAIPILAITDKVTDVRNLVEKDANCGFWSSADNLESAVKNIELLTSDKKLRTRMGQNGRKYCKGHFDVKESVKILEGIEDGVSNV